jgi:CRISPR/Cas system endoribonuclease Cas6 (RAMP superfamily)
MNQSLSLSTITELVNLLVEAKVITVNSHIKNSEDILNALKETKKIDVTTKQVKTTKDILKEKIKELKSTRSKYGHH